MVSHLNSFRYVEMDDEFIETPCQNFKEVPQTVATTKTASKVPKITRPPLKMASLKDAKAVVEEGGCTIWGQLLIFPINLTNLVWVLLQEPREFFAVLASGNHHYGSTTMELML